MSSRPTTRGRVRTDPPPPVAPRRLRRIALAAGACLLVAACSSNGGRTTTPAPAALRIPSPFEVGQQIGVGDLTLVVGCADHRGDVLIARVTATDAGSRPLTLDPADDFTAFAGTRRRPVEQVDGPRGPLPPNGQASYELRFRVPAKYRYPLLWFDDRRPGSPGVTVVVRPDRAPTGAPDCRG